MPLDRVVALSRIMRGIEARGLRHETGAVLMRHRDVAEQVEQLGLRLVYAGISGDHDLGAPM